METIKSEALENSGLVTDLDNFRSRNLEIDLQNGLSVVYPSCEIYSYEQNLFRLISDSALVNFKPRWTMRPDYTSFDSYGTTVHWALILLVNDIYSIEDYRGLDKVLIPPSSLLTEIIRDRVPKREVEILDKFISVPGVSMFKRLPFDNIEKGKINSVASIESAVGAQIETESDPVPVRPVMEEIVEQFVLSADDVQNKYIDLFGTPINYSCIYLYVGGFSIPQKYGYDFVLTYNSNREIKRISWNPSECFNNKSVLSNLLKEGITIKVKFLQLRTAGDNED